MELKEIMEEKVFAVVGDTLNEEKFAYKIKKEMRAQDYIVYGVGKELASINDIPEEIDIIDLCIHPAKGLALIKDCKKSFKCIVIQPGAESQELLAYLKEKQLPYIESCLLVGLKLKETKSAE
ncbi:MAG: CoA-binding protein [Anaerovoracaceae bacterium]